MKKILHLLKTSLPTLVLIFSFATFVCAQFVTNPYGMSRPPIFGSSPFQDSLWGVDSSDHSIKYKIGPTLAGFTITGMTGLTMHPHTGEHFIIMKVSGVSGRVLGKYNVLTGQCTQIGNLGDNFSTISFREDGQLFGVTGDGSAVPETMYLIDHNDATKVVAAALGAGADGEVIAYDYDSDLFFHWSGNGTVVFESVLSVPPYTATNIPIIGATNGETFGAVYLGGNRIRISNISSNFNHIFTNGTWGAAFGSNPDDLRGLALVGRWVDRTGDSVICANDSSLFEAFATSGVSNRHAYQWVLNGVDIPGANSPTYYANQDGWYNCRIALDTLYSSPIDSAITPTTDTAWFGRRLHVNPLPVVTLNPNGTTYLCDPGDSIELAGVGGAVTNQWWMNGSMIPSATNDTIWVNAAGSYNMMTTDANGCSDTAAVPATILNVPTSLMTPTGSSVVCSPATVALSVTGGADSYQWIRNDTVVGGATTNTINAGTTGTFECIVTYGNCADTIGSYSLTVLDCSGIEENVTAVINIYPNPVHDKLNISISNDIIIQKIEIVDLTGRKVIVTNVNGSNASIGVETLRNGTYLVSITTDKGIQTRRFVKH